MRWDFAASENSMGFHSPQETARIYAVAIDYGRQAQLEALRAMPAR
jgi:nitrite reductase (cytochrome c-552)